MKSASASTETSAQNPGVGKSLTKLDCEIAMFAFDANLSNDLFKR